MNRSRREVIVPVLHEYIMNLATSYSSRIIDLVCPSIRFLQQLLVYVEYSWWYKLASRYIYM